MIRTRIACVLLVGGWAAVAWAQPALTPVAALAVPGSFFGDQALCADAGRIYLVSNQGDLFVLARNRATGFPLQQTLHVGVPLTAIRGDSTNLYVTATDGKLRTYRKGSPVKLSRTTTVSATQPLRSLALVGSYLYVGLGTGEVEADSARVYFSAMDFGDKAVEVKTNGTITGKVYGQPEQFMTTVVFNRSTKTQLGTINNPGAQTTMMLDSGSLYQTVCPDYGTAGGFWQFSKTTLTQTGYAGWSGMGCVAPVTFGGVSYQVWGDEAGRTGLVDLADQVNGPFISFLDWSAYTGYTISGDIQIRSLWADGLDTLIFGASSWNNDPAAPSVFVMEPVAP